MGRLVDALRACLDAQQLRYDVIEGATALRFGFQTEEHRWWCVAEAREAQDVILFVSVLPVPVDASRRGAIAELLVRLNHGLSIGNFDMDFDDGNVRFRTSIDLEGSTVEPALIRQLLRANLATVSRQYSTIEQVAAGMSPTDALAAAAR